jgi:two-component system, OmpR family, KDP operon response regulator KdpE
MSKAPVVLTVDDEPSIRRLIKLELESQSFTVIEAEDGRSAITIADRDKPDAIVLDVKMPDMSGLEVMRALREKSSVPIILLTGRDGDQQKVDGLQGGADDYLVKPFNPDELSARLRAVLRRYAPPDQEQAKTLLIEDVEIDLHRRLVKKAGKAVALTRTEWMLLHRLAQSPGKTILNGELLSQVWGPAFREDLQYLRVWVSRLRGKLETDPSNPTIVMTKPGVGYKLTSPAAVEADV